MSEVGHLRNEIEHTRAELGDTVEALAAKADVKARVRHAASDAADEVRTTARDAADRATRVGRDAADQATRVGRRLVQPPLAWILLGIGALAAAAAVMAGWRRR